MTMIHCDGKFSLDIADISDDDLNSEFRKRETLVFKLKGEWQDNLEEKEAKDFSAEDLITALNMKGLEANPWAFEVYQMIAEGRADDAMDAMRSEIPELASPSHERAVADLLSNRRA